MCLELFLGAKASDRLAAAVKQNVYSDSALKLRSERHGQYELAFPREFERRRYGVESFHTRLGDKTQNGTLPGTQAKVTTAVLILVFCGRCPSSICSSFVFPDSSR